MSHVLRGVGTRNETYTAPIDMIGAAESSTGLADAVGDHPTSRGFEVLRAGFRASGGITSGDDLARLLEVHRLGDFVGLAKLIARNEAFGFAWNGSFWIPMFQFNLCHQSLQTQAGHVVAAWGRVLDGWNLAAWFIHPHVQLGDCRPVDVLAHSPSKVMVVAAMDREWLQSQTLPSGADPPPQRQSAA